MVTGDIQHHLIFSGQSIGMNSHNCFVGIPVSIHSRDPITENNGFLMTMSESEQFYSPILAQKDHQNKFCLINLFTDMLK